VRDGDFVVLVSEALLVEISSAPPVAQATFASHRGFHAVNVLRGYPLIEIRSPLEVIDGEA